SHPFPVSPAANIHLGARDIIKSTNAASPIKRWENRPIVWVIWSRILFDYLRRRLSCFSVTKRIRFKPACSCRPNATRRRPGDAAALAGQPGSGASDAIGLERREAVEIDRAVARRVRAGAQDLDLVADLQVHRQAIGGLLVEDVGAVAGRAGEHDRAGRRAVARRRDRVLDALVHGLGEAAELADIEIDPAALVLEVLLRDQHHLGLDDAGIADQAAPGLDDDLGDLV